MFQIKTKFLEGARIEGGRETLTVGTRFIVWPYPRELLFPHGSRALSQATDNRKLDACPEFQSLFYLPQNREPSRVQLAEVVILRKADAFYSHITRDLTGHKLYSPWAACLLIFSSNCGIYFPFLYIYANINQFSARDTTTHHLFSQQYMLCVEGALSNWSKRRDMAWYPNPNNEQ